MAQRAVCRNSSHFMPSKERLDKCWSTRSGQVGGKGLLVQLGGVSGGLGNPQRGCGRGRLWGKCHGGLEWGSERSDFRIRQWFPPCDKAAEEVGFSDFKVTVLTRKWSLGVWEGLWMLLVDPFQLIALNDNFGWTRRAKFSLGCQMQLQNGSCSGREQQLQWVLNSLFAGASEKLKLML